MMSRCEKILSLKSSPIEKGSNYCCARIISLGSVPFFLRFSMLNVKRSVIKKVRQGHLCEQMKFKESLRMRAI